MNCKTEVDKMCKWVSGIVNGAGKSGVVMGLSGGIDSAVVAAVCAKALGNEKVYALYMPCKSNRKDYSDAKLVSKHLKIELGYICLDHAYNAMVLVSTLDCGHIAPNQLAVANIKPRLRMIVLYKYAAEMDRLVAGTENKSEKMVGYCTKWGDSASDFETIADFYKTEVFKLAKYLGIPSRIITKNPSAGLWNGQTDEGELGITYKKLDKILRKPGQDFVLDVSKKGKDSYEEVNVKKLYRNSMHKRAPTPYYER